MKRKIFLCTALVLCLLTIFSYKFVYATKLWISGRHVERIEKTTAPIAYDDAVKVTVTVPDNKELELITEYRVVYFANNPFWLKSTKEPIKSYVTWDK